MIENDLSPAGPQTSPAGRPGHRHDPPIPFAAFGPLAAPPELDVIADTIDGHITVTGSDPTPGATPPSADEARAPLGRVLLAVGPAVRSHADAEVLVSRLCADLGGLGLSEHAPPDDLEHWAHADAVRATSVDRLDLVICAHDVSRAHDLPHPGRRVVVVVDAPQRRQDAVTAAVEQLPGSHLSAVLSDAGWALAPTGGEAAAVAAAMTAQAGRTGGRALVFPGQAELLGDTTVREALTGTALDQVHSVQGLPEPDAVLRCHGYARPRYQAGALTLAVAHDSPDLLVAIEVRYSRPCCGAHAEDAAQL